MIRSLELQNYRGFGEYRVEYVADVNLFVGRNNVGKTTLLEAAQLVHSLSPLTTLRTIANRRRETGTLAYDPPQSHYPPYRNVADLSHVFHGHRIRPEKSMVLIGEGTSKLTFEIAPITEDEGEGNNLFGSFESPEILQTLLLVAKRGDEVVQRGEITDAGLLLDTQALRQGRPRRRNDNTVFISPDSMSQAAIINLYNEVVLRAAEDDLVRALKILDSEVSGVFVLVGERASGVDGSGEILIGRNGSGRNPIGSFGDGMRRLLALAMAFVNTSGGILLVDEVDTGLHYSVMSDLWKLILGSTQAFGIQAFTTTHSLDCMRGLQEALEESPERAERVAVHKVDGRLDKAVTLTGAKLINALRADLELR